jgi:beta-lactam-binding protein with PASTA domain
LSQGISVEVVEVYNEKISEGSFISQSINAGTKLDEGTQVKVYYSLGDTISIPDYTGELKVDFEEWVKEQNEMGANINLQVYEEYNENIEYGKITAQSVYNDNIGLSENIKIIVSLGESYEVINFSSWSRNTIENYCERNELRVVFEEVEDSDLSRGRVVSQKPESGTIISKKDFIIIEIAD